MPLDLKLKITQILKEEVDVSSYFASTLIVYEKYFSTKEMIEISNFHNSAVEKKYKRGWDKLVSYLQN